MGRIQRIGITMTAFVLCVGTADSWGGPQQEAELGRQFDQLGNPQVARDQAAMSKILEIGLPAIARASDAALSDDVTISTRAIAILKTFYFSEDEKLHEAARDALQALTQSDNVPAAGRARSVLATREIVLQWVKQMEGEYKVDEAHSNKPVIALNLDRTRGIDPLFALDS
jgi:hypothetical protein